MLRWTACGLEPGHNPVPGLAVSTTHSGVDIAVIEAMGALYGADGATSDFDRGAVEGAHHRVRQVVNRLVEAVSRRLAEERGQDFRALEGRREH